jgi:hypothetical protein
MRSALAVLGVVAAICAAGVERAWGAPSPVTIDDPEPALTKGDGGNLTAALGFTNVTNGDVTLKLEPANASDSDCRPTADPSSLLKAQHTDVEVTIPNKCLVPETGFAFDVAATPTGEPAVSFRVTSKPKPEEDPPWGWLWIFPALLLVMAFVVWQRVKRWDPPGRATRNVTQPLKYMPATWSFKDSWVTNVTVAAGVLTGIFGTAETVKAFLGEEAEKSLALATVAAAVAVAFTAAAPIIVLATKVDKASDDKTKVVSLGGLLLAAIVTLAGALGQVVLVTRSAWDLDLDGFEKSSVAFAVAAAVLLLVYGLRGLLEALETGLTAPKKKKGLKQATRKRGARRLATKVKADETIDSAKVDTLLVEAMREDDMADFVGGAYTVAEKLRADADIDSNKVDSALAELASEAPAEVDDEVGDDDYAPVRRAAVL